MAVWVVDDMVLMYRAQLIMVMESKFSQTSKSHFARGNLSPDMLELSKVVVMVPCPPYC